jgi:hypothetical protein
LVLILLVVLRLLAESILFRQSHELHGSNLARIFRINRGKILQINASNSVVRHLNQSTKHHTKMVMNYLNQSTKHHTKMVMNSVPKAVKKVRLAPHLLGRNDCYPLLFEPQIFYLGVDDLHGQFDQQSENPDACCQWCTVVESCTHWTWYAGRCQIQRGRLSAQPIEYLSGIVSGRVALDRRVDRLAPPQPLPRLQPPLMLNGENEDWQRFSESDPQPWADFERRRAPNCRWNDEDAPFLEHATTRSTPSASPPFSPGSARKTGAGSTMGAATEFGPKIGSRPRLP